MNLDDKVGRYLTLRECIKSETAIRKGIDNTPTEEHLINMHRLCNEVYDKLCDKMGSKLPFTSFYRSAKLNKAIGGSPSSAHSKGLAIDLDVDGSSLKITNADLFNATKHLLNYDQLIWEFGDDKQPAWVHIGLGNTYRNQELKAIKVNGKTVYQII